MFEVSIRSNLKEIEKKLDALARQQLPFATAQALTALAKIVQADEQANMHKVLDRPTPFTINSVAVRRASKSSQEATVFVKDIAAAYLDPYEFGGKNRLNSRALLKPVDLSVNQYGNLARAKLAQLKARSDIFIGPVKMRSGQVINGVWQRSMERATVATAKGKSRITRRGLNDSGKLKLLIRFEDAHEVTQHLGWFALAERVVAANFSREFGRALARALATAR